MQDTRPNLCGKFTRVRFTPNSGHVQCNSACPLSANNGHQIPAPANAYRLVALLVWQSGRLTY
jgi:hypothetical protein